MTLYGDERLARLLRLLRPAPQAWVESAKRIFLDHRVSDTPAPARKLLTIGDFARLRRALEADPVFRMRFDADPGAAAEDAGMPDIAVGLQQEIRELVALAERVAYDEVFRVKLEADPVATFDAAGVPEAAAEQLLSALVPDQGLARMSEVVAHHQGELPLKAHLVLLLLGSTAVTEKIHAAARGA